MIREIWRKTTGSTFGKSMKRAHVKNKSGRGRLHDLDLMPLLRLSTSESTDKQEYMGFTKIWETCTITPAALHKPAAALSLHVGLTVASSV